MEERETKRKIVDKVMKEERKMRANEGYWVHWKPQIQLKQDCWIENSKITERVTEEMNRGESEKKGEERSEICETWENILP